MGITGCYGGKIDCTYPRCKCTPPKESEQPLPWRANVQFSDGSRVVDGVMQPPGSSEKDGEGAAPECDNLARDHLDSNDIDAWRSLAYRWERAARSASGTREQGLEEAAQLAEGWDYPMLAADIRALASTAKKGGE